MILRTFRKYQRRPCFLRTIWWGSVTSLNLMRHCLIFFRLSFHRCLSRGGFACWDTPPHLGRHPLLLLSRHPQADTTPWEDTPCIHPPVQCMLGYDQQAGGTHPTGMRSCIHIFFEIKLLMNLLFVTYYPYPLSPPPPPAPSGRRVSPGRVVWMKFKWRQHILSFHYRSHFHRNSWILAQVSRGVLDVRAQVKRKHLTGYDLLEHHNWGLNIVEVQSHLPWVERVEWEERMGVCDQEDGAGLTRAWNLKLDSVWHTSLVCASDVHLRMQWICLSCDHTRRNTLQRTEMALWDELAHPPEVDIPLSSGCPSLSLLLSSFYTVASQETHH